MTQTPNFNLLGGMEDSEAILINLLVEFGVSVPPTVSTIHHLTPATLYVVCSNALRLIDPSLVLSYPATLPEDSMADQINICTDLASAFRNLGFSANLSFHQFLYPSKEDLYKLVRFLVGRLSKSSLAHIAGLGDEVNVRVLSKEKVDDGEESLQNKEVVRKLNDLRLKTVLPESSDSNSKSEEDLAQRIYETTCVLQNREGVEISVEESRQSKQDSGSGECSQSSSPGVESLGRNDVSGLNCPQNDLLQDQENTLKGQLNVTTREMVSDSQKSVESNINQVNDQVEAKICKLKEPDSEWMTFKHLCGHAIEDPLQVNKRNLEQSLRALYPEVHGKLTKTKEIELETESVLAEIKRREKEIYELSSELKKQPKMEPRKSYIEQIIEITKNSRKQDADIQRVLKDTRELQLESNIIQERLNRTYAVVDETIFREAKKDPIVRQAYRLLTSIHESFEQIAEKILATDRCRRDLADYEAKLAIINARSLNIDKLEADLDAIRKENDNLEQLYHTRYKL